MKCLAVCSAWLCGKGEGCNWVFATGSFDNTDEVMGKETGGVGAGS